MTKKKSCKAHFNGGGEPTPCIKKSGHKGAHRSTPGTWEENGDPLPELNGAILEWTSGSRNAVWRKP